MDQETNLRLLRPSRKPLKDGDVFVLQPDEGYLFGRVISTGTLSGWFAGSIIVYIFRVTSASKDLPPRAELSPHKLLVPPIITTRQLWSQGFFETIAHLPLEAGDVLVQHCFRSAAGKYYDATGHELRRPVEPVGDWGVTTRQGIDRQITQALASFGS
jgi:hypothetical protein